MERPYQNTMLLPACYAVLSDEEMTYLDGGSTVPLFTAFGYEVSFNTDEFATFCQSAAANLLVMMTSFSFQYIVGRLQSGHQNGLSFSGTIHHSWDKMNGWSKVASIGVVGLAGIYAVSQVVSLVNTVKSLYDIITDSAMPDFSQAQTSTAAA